MQKITKEQLLERAVSLLADGTVSHVLGWAQGEFDYDITPAVFSDEASSSSSPAIHTASISFSPSTDSTVKEYMS